MAKVGILGGTFDPVHFGHITMGNIAIEKYNLDYVMFMPTKIPPHKNVDHISPEQVRAEMIKLSIEDNNKLVYSDFELCRDETTYTAKTLTLLRRDNPEDKFYFIMGGDSLYNIDTWYHPEIILKNAVVIVFNRGKEDVPALKRKISEIEDNYGGQIELITIDGIEISSSMIRQKIKDGENIEKFVPKKVAEYIYQNHCYFR